jgi:hypothetical protein
MVPANRAIRHGWRCNLQAETHTNAFAQEALLERLGATSLADIIAAGHEDSDSVLA